MANKYFTFLEQFVGSQQPVAAFASDDEQDLEKPHEVQCKDEIKEFDALLIEFLLMKDEYDKQLQGGEEPDANRLMAAHKKIVEFIVNVKNHKLMNTIENICRDYTNNSLMSLRTWSLPGT